MQPSLFVTEVGAYPAADRLARIQAARGEVITSRRHESVDIDDALGRRLLTLLDGSRDRTALRGEIISFMKEHGTLPQTEGEPEQENRIAGALETYLQKLSRLALLVQ
jgi:hypothetical protein